VKSAVAGGKEEPQKLKKRVSSLEESVTTVAEAEKKLTRATPN
jgi:hypothetical protein